MTSYRKRAYTYLILSVILWGIASPIIKFTLEGLDPFPFLLYRFFISGFVAVFVIALRNNYTNKLKEHFPQILIYSLLSTTIGLGLLFLGMDITTLLDAILITVISPLVTTAFGYFFLAETITKQERVGILIAVLGTIVVSFEPILESKSATLSVAGNILIIGYMLSTGYSSVISKKLTRLNFDGFYLSNISFLIGFISLLPIIIYKSSITELTTSLLALEPVYHIGVIYMAIFSGTLAYALYIQGQKSIEISEAGLFYYLTPLISVPLAVIWLDERITFVHILGLAIIAIGVIIAETKRRII